MVILMDSKRFLSDLNTGDSIDRLRTYCKQCWLFYWEGSSIWKDIYLFYWDLIFYETTIFIGKDFNNQTAELLLELVGGKHTQFGGSTLVRELLTWSKIVWS